MKKFISILVLLVCGVVGAIAVPITPEQARDVAQQFAKSGRAHLAPGVGAVAPKLAYTARNNNFYVFNLSRDAGFVLVAGDDRAPSVLAYSDEGAFDFATMPENARAWLEVYEAEMSYLKSHPQAQGRNRISYNRVVNPLIKTLWDQSAPFNNYCPTYDNGMTTYTGCVATAMAQMMYYYQWPPQGRGSNTYEDKVGDSETQTLSRDFSQSTYAWDDMLLSYGNGYTTAQANAVARLMSDCGIAVNMHYGSDGSGAQTIAARDALVNNFDYDATTQFVVRSKCTGDEWEQMIVDELNASRPVMYAGQASGGGHEFICDGYNSEGYFHFNWGWSGNSNGYFLLTALNPREQGIGSFEGGYNNNQEIIIGIKPNQGGETLPGETKLYIDNFEPEVDHVALGERVDMPIKGFRLFYTEQPEIMAMGFLIYDANGEEVDDFIFNVNIENIKQGAGYTWSTYYKPSTELGEGEYDIYVAATFDAEEYFIAETPPGKPNHIHMTIIGNTAYFSNVPAPGDLVVNGITIAPTIQSGTQSFAEVNLGCDNGEYNANVYLALLDGNNEMQYMSNGMLIDLCAGRTTQLSTSIAPEVSAGNYTLVVLNNAYQMVGTGVPVTVTNDATILLELVSNIAAVSSQMPTDDLRASATIRNSGQYDFYGSFETFVLPHNGRSILARPRSGNVSIPAGEQVTVNFICDFGGVVGQSYDWYLRNPNDLSARYIWDDPTTFTIIESRPTATLAQIIDEGEANTDYRIDNNLIVMSEMAPDGNVYATDGQGAWVCIANYPNGAPAPFEGMSLLGRSITGIYSKVNGNPTLTLTTAPYQGENSHFAIKEYDLSNPLEAFAPAPCEVLRVTGYYSTKGGTPKLRGYDSEAEAEAQGQSLDLDFGWCSGSNTMQEDKPYTIHGVARLKSDWEPSAAPRRVGANDPLAFQNYTLNAFNYPSTPTAIDTIKAGDATVKSVQYVNALGQASDRPFNGLNIVVTTHTDGTVKTAKVVF